MIYAGFLKLLPNKNHVRSIILILVMVLLTFFGLIGGFYLQNVSKSNKQVELSTIDQSTHNRLPPSTDQPIKPRAKPQIAQAGTQEIYEDIGGFAKDFFSDNDNTSNNHSESVAKQLIKPRIKPQIEPLINSQVPLKHFDKYRVELGADPYIEIPGAPGELKVWIGNVGFIADFREDMNQASTILLAVGETAKIEPFAPAFDIEPRETQCIKIHPSGSEVKFKLIPKEAGIFRVGANVWLFDSFDCRGSPVPKDTATLEVEVKVNDRKIWLQRLNSFINAFWGKLLEFWVAILMLIFGILLYLIEGKLKEIFGYKR